MYTEQLQNAAEIAVTTLVAIMQTGKSEHARVAACRLVLQMAAKLTADGRPLTADGGPMTGDDGPMTGDGGLHPLRGYPADNGQPLNGRPTAPAGGHPHPLHGCPAVDGPPSAPPALRVPGGPRSTVHRPPSAVPAPRTVRSELQAVREAGEILERCMVLMEGPPKKPAPLAKMPMGRNTTRGKR